MEIQASITDLIDRYPALGPAAADIGTAAGLLISCFKDGGKVLLCGNGGSSADCAHICGELLKGFNKRRPLPDELQKLLIKSTEEYHGGEKPYEHLYGRLQQSLPAIDLSANHSLITAVSNDHDPSLIFAQQVLGYGKKGDILLTLSTSGNSANTAAAVRVANALELHTIGMTGASGGILAGICDVVIKAGREETAKVQELHMPIYHCLCSIIEDYFF
jgi:D-sedoheptulose 7-phosphate isomerase